MPLAVVLWHCRSFGIGHIVGTTCERGNEENCQYNFVYGYCQLLILVFLNIQGILFLVLTFCLM